MKKVYFVRHGQSISNVDGIRRGPETKLTDRGRQQIKILAERFKKIDVELVLSSPYRRAFETGKAIADIKNVPLVEIGEARERELPDAVLGKHRDDPMVTDMVAEVFEGWVTGDSKYNDAEDYTELIERADKLRAIVEQRAENNIVIASHGLFGKIFTQRVLLGEYMTPKQALYTIWRMKTSNTGMSVYQVDEHGNWTLLNWNDDAHLGELNKNE